MAALICFVVGVLVGIPALRLKGVYLALVTLALAQIFPALVRKFDVTGGSFGHRRASATTPPSWTGLETDRRGRGRVALRARRSSLLGLGYVARAQPGEEPGRAGRWSPCATTRTAAAVMGVNVAVTKTIDVRPLGGARRRRPAASTPCARRQATPDEPQLHDPRLDHLPRHHGDRRRRQPPRARSSAPFVYYRVDEFTPRAARKTWLPGSFSDFLEGRANLATLVFAALLILLMFVAPFGIVGLAKRSAGASSRSCRGRPAPPRRRPVRRAGCARHWRSTPTRQENPHDAEPDEAHDLAAVACVPRPARRRVRRRRRRRRRGDDTTDDHGRRRRDDTDDRRATDDDSRATTAASEALRRRHRRLPRRRHRADRGHVSIGSTMPLSGGAAAAAFAPVAAGLQGYIDFANENDLVPGHRARAHHRGRPVQPEPHDAGGRDAHRRDRRQPVHRHDRHGQQPRRARPAERGVLPAALREHRRTGVGRRRELPVDDRRPRSRTTPRSPSTSPTSQEQFPDGATAAAVPRQQRVRPLLRQRLRGPRRATPASRSRRRRPSRTPTTTRRPRRWRRSPRASPT